MRTYPYWRNVAPEWRSAEVRKMSDHQSQTTPIDPDPDFSDKIRARAQLNERLSRIEAKLDRVIEMLEGKK